MARKSLASIDPRLAEMTEEFAFLSELKGELANEVVKAQDKSTRNAIMAVHGILLANATGGITEHSGGKLRTVKVDMKWISANLLWLAVEIVKGLALVDLRVVNFTFPTTQCATCGATINEED